MKYQVLCVFGGCSLEHEISILTALSLFEESFEQYELIPLYIDYNHHWYSGEILKQRSCYLQKEYHYLNEVDLKKRKKGIYLCEKGFLRRKKRIDFVLPLFHGKNGEDGVFQGYLNMLQIPFASPSLLTCALAHDKGIMKHMLQDGGVAVVPYFEVHRHQLGNDELYAKCARLKYPLILKPSSAGSSIGIKVVEDIYSFQRALETCFQYDDIVVVERYFKDVREFHGAIIKDGNTYECSAIEEIQRHDPIFSFDEKYVKERKNNFVQKAIESELLLEIEDILKRCADIIRLEGMVRIDFLYVDDLLYVNEINVIPGSLAMHLWKEKMEPEVLLTKLIRIGLKQFESQQKEKYNEVDFSLLHHKK